MSGTNDEWDDDQANGEYDCGHPRDEDDDGACLECAVEAEFCLEELILHELDVQARVQHVYP